MGKVPLGPSKPEPRARPAGHQDDPDLARGQRVGARCRWPRRHTRRSPSVWGSRTTSIGWTSSGAAAAAGFPCTSSAISRSSRSKSIARDLGRQPRPRVVVQLIPPAQKVTLSVTIQDARLTTGSGDISCQTPGNMNKRLGVQARGPRKLNSEFHLKPVVRQGDPRREGSLRRAVIEAVRKMGQEGPPRFQ